MHLRSLVFSPAVHPAILPHIRRFTTPSYDIFKKLKDSSDGGDSSSQSASAGRRKPSDRVIRLVDEILNLTLIESADLCDLCQERLAGPNVNGGFIPGRSPFPHPHTFFSGVGMMPERLSPMGMMPQPVAATVETAEPPPAETPQPTKPAQKSTGTLTLVGFDATKKIALIKLVRTITGLGLRESKELVESAPRQLKKDLPLEEVQKLAQDLEAAGATIKID